MSKLHPKTKSLKDLRLNFPGPGSYMVNEKRVLPDVKTIIYKKPPLTLNLKTRITTPEPGTYDLKP
jgi:hypothetical protein